MKHTNSFLILLGLIILSYGCKREVGLPSTESEILTPILSTKLSILEIVPDSLRKIDDDDLVVLSYRNEVYQAPLNSFQPLETREFEETAKLQSLTLGTQSAQRSVSLGQLAEAEGGFTGQLIISQHGSNATIPPINNLTYGPIPVDGTEFFESVTLDSGYMDVTLDNGFPTSLSNIEFEIRNQSDNSLVGTGSFAHLPAGAQQTRTIDLAGKTVEGELYGNILNLDVDGTSGPVPIDTSDKIWVTITVRDMKVYSATAIFPAQDIISIADTSGMANVDDLRLTKATAKKGFVTVRVVSTVEDTLFFNYFVPEGKKDGVPLEINASVPPAPPGGSIESEFKFPVDGYTFDLTGQPVVNHYNAFYSELTGRIDSTGRLVNLSLDDSILVYVQLSEFIPEYIEGYLGNVPLEVGPEDVPTALFQAFQSGTLEFEHVNVAVGVVNGNGVPFDIAFESLKAKNTRTGTDIDIDLTSLPTPMQVQAAPSTQSPWEGLWELDESSSNFNEALSSYPNLLTASLRFESNPAQDTADMQQFAVDSAALSAFLDVEVPLSMFAEELVLSDTLSIDPSAWTSDGNHIGAGTFYLTATNSLPLSAALELRFLDAVGNVTASLAFDDAISGGSEADPSQATVSAAFDDGFVTGLEQASQIVVLLEAETMASGFQKIYSNQHLALTLSARFQFHTRP